MWTFFLKFKFVSNTSFRSKIIRYLCITWANYGSTSVSEKNNTNFFFLFVYKYVTVNFNSVLVWFSLIVIAIFVGYEERIFGKNISAHFFPSWYLFVYNAVRTCCWLQIEM